MATRCCAAKPAICLYNINYRLRWCWCNRFPCFPSFALTLTLSTNGTIRHRSPPSLLPVYLPTNFIPTLEMANLANAARNHKTSWFSSFCIWALGILPKPRKRVANSNTFLIVEHDYQVHIKYSNHQFIAIVCMMEDRYTRVFLGKQQMHRTIINVIPFKMRQKTRRQLFDLFSACFLSEGQIANRIIRRTTLYYLWTIVN